MSSSRMICQICRSTEYYEDEQGDMCCAKCGTQSQDYVAESFEIDDGMVGLTGRLRQFTQKRLKVTVPKESKKVATVQPSGFISNFLIAFQCCLKAVSLEFIQVFHYERFRDEFVEGVKHLWQQYLIKWQQSGCRMTDIECDSGLKPDLSEYDCFVQKQSSHTADAQQDDSIDRGERQNRTYRHVLSNKPKHPLYPSQPLILGFIYLQIRRLNLTVIPADLVQAIRQQRLVFHGLLNVIPLDIRKGLTDSQSLVFNVQPAWYPVTPSNILFHATSLAASLEILFPCLDVCALGLYFIQRLGFPPVVWQRFVDLLQLNYIINKRTNESKKRNPYVCDALPLLSTENVQHPERVLAIIIVAVRFCVGWECWAFVVDPCLTRSSSSSQNNGSSNALNSENTSIALISSISNLSELDRVPRKDLPLLMSKISRSTDLELKNLTDNSRILFFNKTIRDFLQIYPLIDDVFDSSGQLSVVNPSHSQSMRLSQKPEQHDPYSWVHSQGLTGTASNIWSENTIPGERVINSHSIISGSGTRKDGAFLVHVNPSDCIEISKSPEYMLYPKIPLEVDSMGITALPYTALLERCAKYLEIAPGMLHILVQDIDELILACTARKGYHASYATGNTDSYEVPPPGYEVRDALKGVQRVEKRRPLQSAKLESSRQKRKFDLYRAKVLSDLERNLITRGGSDSLDDSNILAPHLQDKKRYFKRSKRKRKPVKEESSSESSEDEFESDDESESKSESESHEESESDAAPEDD